MLIPGIKRAPQAGTIGLMHFFSRIFFLMFIYFFDRDRARVEEGQRERETQNPQNQKQAPGYGL